MDFHFLIAQHGSVLTALTALQQHLEAQRNDKQTDSLENPVPHIDVPAEFNQGTSKSAHERRNRLQRKRRAQQREQCSFGKDALQLFGDEDASAPGRWDCGEMDTICGFCSAKMWIKERSATSINNNPKFFSVLRERQSFVAESSCNTVRAGSSFNQQSEQCYQISRSDSHVQFGVGIHFARCQS